MAETNEEIKTKDVSKINMSENSDLIQPMESDQTAEELQKREIRKNVKIRKRPARNDEYKQETKKKYICVSEIQSQSSSVQKTEKVFQVIEDNEALVPAIKMPTEDFEKPGPSNLESPQSWKVDSQFLDNDAFATVNKLILDVEVGRDKQEEFERVWENLPDLMNAMKTTPASDVKPST